MSPKLIVIVGPTGSGKSDLAMELAGLYGGELICADSKTIYRGMDIGTAKPSAADRALVPHHLLDVVNPDQPFSVFDFQRMARQAIGEITARGHIPIMVGGSGLYVDSILYDFHFPTTAEASRREELNTKSIEELREILKTENPIKYSEIDLMNIRRIIRAIENNENNEHKSRKLRTNTLLLGLDMNKLVIQNRIEQRAKKMLKEGIIEEVRGVGYKFGWESEAMSGIIYRAFKEIAKNDDKNPEKIKAALDKFIQGDKKLVKKQLTWFRRNKDIVWLEAEDTTELLARAGRLVSEFIT